MDRYEASFDVDTKDEARAVSALLDKLYDTVREECMTVSQDGRETEEVLSAFRAMREAGREETPARLTVVYEQEMEGFDE